VGAFPRSFDQPSDITRFPNGLERLVVVAGAPVGLATFQPGWRWSNDVRPLTGTQSCPFHHVGYVLAGVLHVEPNDGPPADLKAGDAYEIEPGHDAWVAGDTRCVLLDWGRSVREYARPFTAPAHEGGSR